MAAARPIVHPPSRRAPARRRRGSEEIKLQQRYSASAAYRPRRAPLTVEDRDACALYAVVVKDAQPAHEPIAAAIAALEKMLHRAGSVDGEGDGCGVLLDIPREIWAEEVRGGGHQSRLTLDERFAVAHVFIPRTADPDEVKAKAREIMGRGGLRILAEREDEVVSSELGPTAREEEPHFWQVGGLIDDPKLTFELTIALEDELDVHV